LSGRQLVFATIAVLGLVWVAPAHAAITLSDDRGKAVSLVRPAQRIVTLAPHLTELVFAAGAGGKLVGVTAYSDFPAAATKLPLVGDSGKLDLERLIQLKPDLVLAWQTGNHPGDVAQMEKLGLSVFVTEPGKLPDIPRLLRTIGRLAGSESQAQAAAATFERALLELRTHYSTARPVSVFYEIWHEPLMTLNGRHMISDVIELCGGRNIFAALPTLTPTVSMENVLAADPEVIIASGSLYNDARLLEAWRKFPRLRAVREGQLYFIHPDLMQRQTPRLIEGARQLCAQLDVARHQGR